jgi:protein disulfide-isomerase
MENKLKIQIWSDIMSILLHRKRRIEGALEQFEHKAAVEIEEKFPTDASFVASEDDDMVEHPATKYQRQNRGTRNDG